MRRIRTSQLKTRKRDAQCRKKIALLKSGRGGAGARRLTRFRLVAILTQVFRVGFEVPHVRSGTPKGLGRQVSRLSCRERVCRTWAAMPLILLGALVLQLFSAQNIVRRFLSNLLLASLTRPTNFRPEALLFAENLERFEVPSRSNLPFLFFSNEEDLDAWNQTV